MELNFISFEKSRNEEHKKYKKVQKIHFTTVVPIDNQGVTINYQSVILSMGSCFAVNIAKKLQHFQYQSVSNPFGIIFNPLSLEKLIVKSLSDDFFSEDDFFQNNGLWHCFDFHSELSQFSLDKIQLIANQQLSILKETILKADYFFITLGTAWVYLIDNQVVANCHKVPQNQFVKKILSPEEIQQSLERMVNFVTAKNPKIRFIFTISPVRHLKDGLTENQRSKAHLLTGLHSFLEKNSKANYFPAYEIMMDELRDYRFYADDLLHPSDLAIEYIWERFSQNYIDESGFADMKIIDSIQKSLQHRPFNPESEQFQIFKEKLKQKIQQITQKYPFMKFL